MKIEENKSLKTYFSCRICNELYEKEPYRCEMCGCKEFKIKMIMEEV